MDLTRTLLRIAAGRPHVLLIAAADGTDARLAVEAEAARRGWPPATSPADADLLVVAGAPGPQLAAVVDSAWRAVPAPRARVAVYRAGEAPAALGEGAAVLVDLDHQRAPHDDPLPGAHAHDHREIERGDHRADDAHGDHPDHPDEPDHGGGHHGHHGGGMTVAGLPMADLGEDRDGLTLDRLHVPLGPVLPDWPPGLVLRVALQGDVVQEATAEVLDAAADDGFWVGPGRRAARELDALARLLGVLGWADPAATARRARDELVAGVSLDQVRPAVTVLLRRVRRSRTLRWQLRGVPAGTTDLATLVDVRLGAAESAVAGDPVPDRPEPDEVAGLVVGAELAAARLVVAAADPALTAMVRRG